MIYIASPYSHKDNEVVSSRVEKVERYAAKLTAKGLIAFSPIAYGHNLLKYEKMPSDYAFWQKFCGYYLKIASALHVLKLDGWDVSTGVTDEIRIAEELGIVVLYIEPDNY